MSWLAEVIMGAVGGTLGTGINLANILLQNKRTKENLGQQQDNLEWQRKAQQITWDREDNAIQRRVADLKAAGLSPTLAAGSAAQASQPISTTAPQREHTQWDKLLGGISVAQQMMQLVQMKADVARTNADTNRIREEINNSIHNRNISTQELMVRQGQLNLNERNLELQSEYLKVSKDQLTHDYMRIENDRQRIKQEAERILNDKERIIIEQNSYELARLMNIAQRGLIDKQTFSEELRHFGIAAESEAKMWNLKGIIYDYALLINLGLPVTGTLPNLQHLNWARGTAALHAIEEADEMTRALRTGSLGIRSLQLLQNLGK